MSKKFYFVMVVLVVMAMLLSACGDVDNGQWTPGAVQGNDLVEVGESAGESLGGVLDGLKSIDCLDGDC